VPRQAVNEVVLHWETWGRPDGPPLVLCHGYCGSSYDFALQVEPLSQTRQVIALDQRGHGQSSQLRELAGYTIDLLTADLVEFIERVADGPVDLLGHSMGGRVSLGVALARPDLIRSLILMDTSAWSFHSADESVRSLVANFLSQFDPAQGVPTSFGMVGPEDTMIEAATPDEWRRRKDEILFGMDAYAIKALGTALLAEGITSVRHQLPSITCPTTVLVGSNDHPLVDQAPELAGEVGDGHLWVIQGAYHSPHVTHPEEWRGAVEQHLQSLRA
jgi:3-oxoadipate enol-lactonase